MHANVKTTALWQLAIALAVFPLWSTAHRSAKAADGGKASEPSLRVLADWRSWPVAGLESRQSNCERGPDGWLVIHARKGFGRSGIVLRPSSGTWDLEAFSEIAVSVRNMTSRPVHVVLRVDDDRSVAQGAKPGASPPVAEVTLPIGKDPVWLMVPLGSRRPSPLAGKLFAMQGNPSDLGRRGSVDAAKIAAVWVFVPNPLDEPTIAVGPIVAQGQPPRLADGPLDRAFPFVDEFGQYVHRDWPGKLHAEQELAERREIEEKDLTAHPRPADWDRFGGWALGPQLPSTGFFRVQKIDGWWWMIDPEGRLFWSHGAARVGTRVRVGSVYRGTPILDREFYFRLPPKDSPLAAFFGTQPQASRGYYMGKEGHAVYDHLEANLWRKYGPQWADQYARTAQRRLSSWALNSIANSSDPAVYNRRQTPYTAIVYSAALGRSEHRIAGAAGDWGGLPDPFDPGLAEAIRRTLQTDLNSALGDPWCLGFFVDNELHWGDLCYPAETALVSPAQQPAKRVFVEQLKSKYGDVAALNAAWGTRHAAWDSLLQTTVKPDRKRKAVQADLEAFTRQIVDAYFRLCRDSIRAASPHHLYLGCRFAGGWNPLVIETAAKYADVVSVNRYTHTVSDLTLPKGLDRPIVIGEFTFCAMDRGLWWPAWFTPVPDQQCRAASYCTYVDSALRNPAVIGTHWFQFYDQPTAGRFDGENYHLGLLDICDTPYWETINACRKTGASMYTIRSQAARGSVSGSVSGSR